MTENRAKESGKSMAAQLAEDNKKQYFYDEQGTKPPVFGEELFRG